MDYQQYFKKTYPGIIPHEIIALDNAIFASCNLAFDYDGRCIDDKLCAVFCKQIKYAYKLVGPFEERLEADIKELEGNNGYSFFYDIDDMHRKAFYSMQTIIEEYHRYLPYIIEDKNEVEDLEGQYINLKSTSPENHIAGLQQEKIIKDQDSAHEGWYINILRSKNDYRNLKIKTGDKRTFMITTLRKCIKNLAIVLLAQKRRERDSNPRCLSAR